MSATTHAQNTQSKAKARKASATKTAKSATDKARRETRQTEHRVSKHTRRVVDAAQAELSAVASQPTRPLLFTLGLVDRATAGVRALPSAFSNGVVSAPACTRGRIIDVFATAGDLAEKGQRGYTEVAKDGEQLFRSVRRQESTQQAVKYADRAQTRATRSMQDVEKALQAGTEAATEAASKLG